MAKFKLKRKSFTAGALLSNAAKIGTKTKFGLGAAGVAGAGLAVANKFGGGDLISGGEKSAKEMEFS